MANLDDLSKLGDRGIVVHELDDGTKESKYFFVLEEEWMKCKLTEAPPRLKEFESVGGVLAQSAKTRGAIVDFNKIKVRKSELKNVPAAAKVEDMGDAIVIKEGADFYVIQPSLWQDNELPPGAEGDAGTLVDRGAAIANIPDDDIPIGTYCVLVNLGLLNAKE
jgi:hypothetical protein